MDVQENSTFYCNSQETFVERFPLNTKVFFPTDASWCAALHRSPVLAYDMHSRYPCDVNVNLCIGVWNSVTNSVAMFIII